MISHQHLWPGRRTSRLAPQPLARSWVCVIQSADPPQIRQDIPYRPIYPERLLHPRTPSGDKDRVRISSENIRAVLVGSEYHSRETAVYHMVTRYWNYGVEGYVVAAPKCRSGWNSRPDASLGSDQRVIKRPTAGTWPKTHEGWCQPR